MDEIDDVIGTVAASCAKLSSLEFLQPGVFTNAIISKPEVTSLIRDALPPELSLYRIVRGSTQKVRYGGASVSSSENDAFVELRPERIDGKSIYADRSFDAGASSAVRVPTLVPQTPGRETAGEELLSPTRKRIASQYKLVPTSVIESNDVNEICRAVTAVVEQYPSIDSGHSVQASVGDLQREYNVLVVETEDLELKVADQRAQLDVYNDSLNELLPRRGIVPLEKEVDVDDMIAQEEREIAALEEELTRRQQ